MTWAQDSTQLQQYLSGDVAAALPDFVFLWDAFNARQAGGAAGLDASASYVRPVLQRAETRPFSEGVDEHTGRLAFQIFTPWGTGDEAAWEAADQLRAMFRLRTLAGFDFRVPAGAFEIPNQSTHFQLNASCPWDRLDIPTTTTPWGTGVATYTIAGHPFTDGLPSGPEAGYWSGATPALAIADDPTRAATYVVIAVDGSTFTLATHGQVVDDVAHDLGSSGKAWASQSTAGRIVAAEPSAGWRQQVLVLRGATALQVEIGPMELAG